MTAAAHDVEHFRGALSRVIGLGFEDDKLVFLAEVLARRAQATGLDPRAYVERLEGGADARELGALASELTVTETYLFRGRDQLDAFVSDVLASRRPEAPLRILSAGCATGDEPYSLAILIRERLPESALGQVSIRAVDLNPAALEQARAGRFSEWSLRQTPVETRARWLRREGKGFVLSDEVKAMVTFVEGNLAGGDPLLWRPQELDVVFCRNVMMYFTPDQQQALIGRIARALVPGGLLFLGHAETLRGVSHEFHLRHTEGTFYYQRKRDGEASPRVEPPRLRPGPDLGSLSEPADLAWPEKIAHAAERIRAITDATRSGASGGFTTTMDATSDVPPSDARGRVSHVLDLFAREQFGDALAALSDLPARARVDPDVMLLRAALLAHDGKLDEAERASRELLARNELDAGAHYLLGLCREGSRDRAGAEEHYRTASYLDPGFAMPRLRLGLLSRRVGKRSAARQELGHALGLIAREDAGRILMFGGGFGRDALAALCRAELAACGEGA